MNLTHLGYSLNFFLRGVRISVPQVETYRIVEKDAVLRYNGDVLPEGIHLDVPNVLAVDQHSAAVGVVDAEHEMQNCSLSKARGPDYCVGGSRLELEAQVIKEALDFGVVFLVPKTDALQLNAALLVLKFLGVRLVLNLGLHFKHDQQVFHVHLGLADFPKQRPHVKQRRR